MGIRVSKYFDFISRLNMILHIDEYSDSKSF
jgi:hypothetical protein